ncbi:MAG: OsmC family protein [Alphaproteobacteria bacterium]|nr:OsmC family protein [Alphaproteobacteria bacterium]
MTHEYRATTTWRRTSAEFTYETYNRAHEVKFGGGETVPWSAAPEFKGEADRVNPEEAYVASLSTCHMLTFLAIAARKRFTVDAYIDEAVGVMERNAQGKFWVARVSLRPKIAFSGVRQPSTGELSELHRAAHENCFVANSVKSEVVVDWQ